MRQTCNKYQNHNSRNKYRIGLTGNAFPLLEDDAPDIAEHHIQDHQDAPAEGDEDGVIREEAFAEGQAEELAVPEEACKAAKHQVVAPKGLLAVVSPGLFLLFW